MTVAAGSGDAGVRRLLLRALADVEHCPLTSEDENAITEIARSTDLDPDLRAQAWVGLARSFRGREDETAARMAIMEAAGLASMPETVRDVAVFVGRTDGPGAGRAFLREHLRVNPDDVTLLLADAWLALDADDHQAAAPAVERAAALAPDDPMTLAALARLKLAEGESEDAVELSRRLVASQPSLGRAIYAIALDAAGRLDSDIYVLNAVVADPPSDPWVLWKLGAALLSANRAKDAESIFDRALSIAPGTVHALRGRGIASAVQGEYDTAAEYLEHASHYSDDDWLRSMRAEVARLRGDTVKAINLFESLDLDTADPWISASFGAALEADGQKERAYETYERALQRDPSDEGLWYRLAVLQFDDEHLEQAEAALHEAIKADPSSARAHALLGEVLRRRGDFEPALRCLDHALAIAPEFSYAVGTKGQTLRQLGRDAEALPVLIEAAGLSPDTTWILEELVSTLEAVEPEGADRVLARLQRDARDHKRNILPLCTVRARLAQRQERWSDADRLYRLAREQVPYNEVLAAEHIDLLRKLRRESEALAIIESLPQPPSDASIRWTRIELLWQLDRLTEAGQELERLNAEPDPPALAVAALGELRRVSGRRDEARALLQDALERDPDDAYAYASLGAVEFEQGNLDSARRWLQAALEREPYYAFAIDQLVSVSLDTGDGAEAMRLLERLGDADPHDSDLTIARARGLYGLGKYAAALDVLDASLLEISDERSLLRARAWIEVELGLSSRAASTFQSSDNTANRPGDLPDLVEGLLRVGQWSAALERILGAADAENLFTDTALAIACADAGLWPAAIQHALRGHGLVEDSPVSNHVAAKVLCLGGRPQQAVDFARTYERLLPRDITSQLWLAECLADSGHRSDAQSVFQTLIARLEKKVYLDASDLQAHAFSLLWIGRTTQAAEAFLRALSATDRTPAVLFNLALCSALEGDGRQAQLLLRKARDDAQRLPLPTRRGVTAVAMHDLEVLASAASSAGTTEIDEMRHVLQQDINRFDANWTDYLDRLTNHEELRKRPSFDRIVSSITPEQK